ncbi:hypothetical protein EVAR_39621_1 [Eumeta japonica]|uniref:Uncharacterized protein n=1 Tax=Eumeta variegata TaxID=151549 RepID=A0A4C1WIT1_EUMVA|nr:hypothetical protein EVAR_39621_1 [Eumeta japonica]
MATPPQLKCMQVTCATDAPLIKCSGSGASDTVVRQPSYCEARLNKEIVKSERKRCPSIENTTPQEIRSPEACTREDQPGLRAHAAIA